MVVENPGKTPAGRLRVARNHPPNAAGLGVVYWMTAARRVRWNFALDRAIGWAKLLNKPLVVVEVLTCGGRWDSDRSHRFVLQGMGDTAKQLSQRPVLYHPYVESRPGESQAFFEAVCRQACVVVTDDHPTAPAVPSDSEGAAVRVEAIDGVGLLPMRAASEAFPTAYAFRRFLQRVLREHLLDAPQPDPFTNKDLPRLASLPPALARRWPAAPPELLSGEPSRVAKLPIDHGVAVVSTEGGSTAAQARWRSFLASALASYPELRNHPDAESTSGLAPYLHFGHISTHEIFHDLAQQEAWTPAKLADKASGGRQGWWGMSEAAEAFLDQLVTWRELGFNACAHRSDYAEYASLPSWAKATLAKHARDRRLTIYRLEQFASARTHDPLWNAAQRQLVSEGRLHNYLRMLWGKKILEWTPRAEEALDVMIALNNRYALDGQDPNSYSGIFWILGRYDRPWGPERPIFGTVRYMSSENTARKVRVAQYLQRYSEEALGWSRASAGEPPTRGGKRS